MSKTRLRIIAGPNGSGKSTFFDELPEKYKDGVFINSDLVEKELATKRYIDLCDFNLNLTQNDLDEFLTTKRAISLIDKAKAKNQKINININRNCIVNKSKQTNSYEAALITSFLRHHLQENKINFCFETVMSHPSKIEEIEEAKLKGYKTYLYFICIDDPEVNISRVENRVQKGGHPVDPEIIKSRYYDTLKNLKLMIENVDECYLFDNSGKKNKLIAEIIQNHLILKVEPKELPNWFIDYVLKYYEIE